MTSFMNAPLGQMTERMEINWGDRLADHFDNITLDNHTSYKLCMLVMVLNLKSTQTWTIKHRKF